MTEYSLQDVSDVRYIHVQVICVMLEKNMLMSFIEIKHRRREQASLCVRDCAFVHMKTTKIGHMFADTLN